MEVNKYVMLYSKLKKSHLTKMHDAVGLLQKPFDYDNSFIKVKKPSMGTRKNNLNDKRMSVFSNTYTGNKSQFGLNKTFDLGVQGKNKHDLSNYGNLVGSRLPTKKDNFVKQKPAAPEIKKKVHPLTQINPSFSDSHMLQYSQVSSVKSFTRPKSMEKLRRKPTNGTKKRSAKSKPRKKTKRGNQKDFSTFDQSGSFMVTNKSGDVRKSFTRDSKSTKPNTSYKNRRQKLDHEIQKLCNSKMSKEIKTGT